MKLLSYGKKIENLYISINNRIIGSAFSTFEEKIAEGDIVLLVCHSQVWGYATVSSKVYFDNTKLWSDKVYPYRARIQDISIFSKAFTFKEFNVDSIFRDKLGVGWAFKVLFTPNSIPSEAKSLLEGIISDRSLMNSSKFEEFFSNESKRYKELQRKKLGLS